MMTPQDKAIEAAAKVVYTEMFPSDNPWTDGERQVCFECAIAVKDAYLAALESEGGAKRGGGFESQLDGAWLCVTSETKPLDMFPVLIIKLPE